MKMKKHICIIFILSLFISSNRIVAQGADKNNDENIEYIILTSKNSSSFEVKDRITRVTAIQDIYTESPSIFFMYESSKMKDSIKFGFLYRIYNIDREITRRINDQKAGTIYPYERMAIRKIPGNEIDGLNPFDLDEAIKDMTKDKAAKLLESWTGKKLGIIDRNDMAGDLVSIYEANLLTADHVMLVSIPSFQKTRPHPQLILPDSTKNQNIKGNLHLNSTRK